MFQAFSSIFTALLNFQLGILNIKIIWRKIKRFVSICTYALKTLLWLAAAQK